MKKDKEWLKGLINEEGIVMDMDLLGRHDEQSWKNENIKINKGRLFYLIDQLDEPKKVVVPKFVADFIEKWKNEGLTMSEWFEFNYDDEDEDKVSKWLYDNDYEENRRREYLLIHAIRYGCEVEKEKLYRVRAGNRYVRFNLDGSIIGVRKENSIVCLERLSKLPFDYKKAVESGIITLEEVTE